MEELAEARKVHRAEVVVRMEWMVVQGLPWGRSEEALLGKEGALLESYQPAE